MRLYCVEKVNDFSIASILHVLVIRHSWIESGSGNLVITSNPDILSVLFIYPYFLCTQL